MHDPAPADRITSASEPQPRLLDTLVLPISQEERQSSAPVVVEGLLPLPLRLTRYTVLWGCALAVVCLLLLERYTSLLQALAFSHWSAQLQYTVGSGPSPSIAFPAAGPFDERRGYTRLKQLTERLLANSYRITQQARQSPQLTDLIQRGIAPPFREPSVAELVIRDAYGARLYAAGGGGAPIWKSLDDIPPLVVRTLLFIENRSIGDGAGPLQNPAVDWGRSSKAFALYIGRSLGFKWPLEGGSTLATQLQKFRHSPSGHTSSPREKLHQVIGASLAAYHEGVSTRPGRDEIILDYLNTMPLGAVPGVGEINGLASGLRAWFGLSPDVVFATLREPQATPAKARVYRDVLALLYSVHAPTYYLTHDHAALDARIDAYLGLLRSAGVIDEPLLAVLQGTHLKFAPAIPQEPPRFIEHKAANATRTELSALLAVPNLYDLDRLNLQVDTTIDAPLQSQVLTLLKRLASPEFVAANNLREPHLLDHGDPKGVTYSLLLVESRPEGNLVRVHTDTQDAPFDVNDGMKLELGSTAKLRTLVHYLELVAQLHDELAPLAGPDLAARAASARDPITRWAAITMFSTPHMSLEELLSQALERHYSGSPDEAFFTGGGIHHFGNFESEDDSRELTVREAVVHSTNLVFIRLMRDLVRFHEARLPYDAQAALEDRDSPARRQLLREIVAEDERRTHTSFAWLLASSNTQAQDTRLTIRIERDAFDRMTPYWRRMGFPFEKLVPSYATAIGSSADRPTALAELMGIIVNEGRRRPTYDIARINLARGTPYETLLAPAAAGPGERVIRAPIARLVRTVLGQVVESGTARRLNGAFHDAEGTTIAVGGKTGSGDNRYETFARDGHLLSAHPVSRTAVFVFYLGEHWFGVITASVAGPQSGSYTFTSSLPLAALKLLAPAFSAAVHHEQIPQLLTQGSRPSAP
jgi:membrane peptidoglycan carboxypeptidase